MKEGYKEDPVRETFPGLLSKAFALGFKPYIPGEGDLGQAMMDALYEVLHWLHKEYRIYLLIGPHSMVNYVAFSISVIMCDEHHACIEMEHEKDDEYYPDWVTAHIEGLKVCLELVEQIKKQDDGTKA